jgi:hypothetical protein
LQDNLNAFKIYDPILGVMISHKTTITVRTSVCWHPTT